MLNSQVLEIATGLIFIFLIASLLATAVREIVESVLKTRAIQLERGIRLLLDDPTGKETTAAMFSHPQLFSLFDGVYEPTRLTPYFQRWRMDETTRGGALVSRVAHRLPLGSKLPSYIPSRNFALALLDLLGRDGGATSAGVTGGAGVPSMEILLAHASALAPSRLRDALLVALNEAQGDFDRARTSLEAWFDSNMDRVSGWYKSESQAVLLLIGLATAAMFNIDTLTITHKLATSNTVRAQVVLQAEAVRRSIGDRATVDGSGLLLDPQALNDAKNGLGDLIGWPDNLPSDWSLLKAIGGWILTGIAISLGAPFWFDLLNKMMVVRATVKPYEKSPAAGSEDRAGSTPAADRLEPQQPVGDTGSNASASAPAAGGFITGSVRLAVNVVGLTDLALTVDDQPVALPANGFADLSLAMGPDHAMALTAKDAAGNVVSWSRMVRVTLDDDAQAIEAVLV